MLGYFCIGDETIGVDSESNNILLFSAYMAGASTVEAESQNGTTVNFIKHSDKLVAVLLIDGFKIN